MNSISARANPRSRRRDGFTLIELMVVVIVLGILAATIIPQFAGVSYDAKVTRSRADIATLEGALERFQIHMDRYPTTQEGLDALVTPPAEGAENWRSRYIKELIPDPWGNPYQYRYPGQHGPGTYDLWSNGADGQPGGDLEASDITNWTVE